MAVIGAGSGLGHGFMVKTSNSDYYEVLPSEGGHHDFSPQDDQDWAYFKFLQYCDKKGSTFK